MELALELAPNAGRHCGILEVPEGHLGFFLGVVLWCVPSQTKLDQEVRVDRAYSLCFI